MAGQRFSELASNPGPEQRSTHAGYILLEQVQTDTSSAPMLRPLFLPTARQTNWLIIVAVLALGEALYVRYMAIENTTVELACRAGLHTWLCSSFWVSLAWSEHDVFGGLALAAGLLNLLRPSVVLVALTLAAAAFGLVLHNADLSALAAGLLILSLARPAPAAE